MTYPLFAPGLYQAGQRCTYEEKVYEKIKTGKVSAAPKVGSVWKLVPDEFTYSPSPANPLFATGVDALTGEPVSYKRITTFPWGGEITQADGVYIRQLANGQYYQRAAPGGLIDMSWWLRPANRQNYHGSDDNHAAVQGFFDYLVEVGAGVQRLNIVYPCGEYFFSKTLTRHSLQLIESAFGTTFYFPAGCRGLEFLRKTDHRTYFQLNHLTLKSLGLAEDGLIDSNSAEYREFLARTKTEPTDVSLFNVGLGLTGEGEPVQKIQSICPTDYQYSAIYANTPVVLNYTECENWSGSGVHLDGRYIYYYYYPGDLFAPYGYNVSLSQINGGEVRQCAAGYVIHGGDGNQCTVNASSARDNRLQNFYSDCTEGNRFIGCHASSSGWGNYWCIGRASGDDLYMCYSEGDPTINRYLGYTTVRAGRMNRNAYHAGVFALVDFGSESNRLTTDALQAVELTMARFFGTGESLKMKHYLSTLQWQYGNLRGVQSLLVPGGRSAVTKRGGLPAGTETRAQVTDGVLRMSANSIEDFLANYPARCQVSDEVTINDAWDACGPRTYVCYQGGMSGPGYDALEDCTLTHADNGTQNYKLSKPSTVLTMGDWIQVNGQWAHIVATQENDYGVTLVAFDPPGVDVPADGVGRISYPKPRFRAIGSGTGTLEQRPKLRAGEDHGFIYWLKEKPDSPTATKQEWNGAEWI